MRDNRDPDRDRANNLRIKYGITVAQYDQMLLDQGGVCACCAGPERITGRRLAVDHDHDTGEIRALLCSNCNRALGLLGDTADGVRQLLAYRERYA